MLLAGASLIREAAVGWLVPAEEAWRTMLARRMTGTTTPTDITLVEIDADTLNKHVWPWKAEDFAVFLASCLPSSPSGKPYEPAVIGIEPPLDFVRGALAGHDGDPDAEDESEAAKTEGPPADSKDPEVHALQDLMRRTPKLVLGGKLGWSREDDRVQPMVPMPVLNNIHGDTRRLSEYTVVDLWTAKSLRLAPPGWINFPDAPGPRGLCPLVVRYRGQPVPTFPLQVAMMWAKATVDDVEVTLGDSIVIGGKVRVPIDDAGNMQVNFGVPTSRLAYDDLLVARYQIDNGNPSVYPPAFFDKKVLILARTDDASRTLEPPVGPKISPGEMVACAVATIQANAHPDRIGSWFDWMLVGLTAVASFWLPRWKTGWMAALVVVCDVAYFVGALSLFHMRMIALPAVLPLGLALWMLLLRFFTKRMQRVIAF